MPEEAVQRADPVRVVADALRRHWERQDAMSIEECCARIAVEALREARLIDGCQKGGTL